MEAAAAVRVNCKLDIKIVEGILAPFKVATIDVVSLNSESR